MPSTDCVTLAAAVADAEIELAVRAEPRAVQVVAEKVVADAVAVAEALAASALPVAVGVFQQPEVGDVGEVDIALADRARPRRCRRRAR